MVPNHLVVKRNSANYAKKQVIYSIKLLHYSVINRPYVLQSAATSCEKWNSRVCVQCANILNGGCDTCTSTPESPTKFALESRRCYECIQGIIATGLHALLEDAKDSKEESANAASMREVSEQIAVPPPAEGLTVQCLSTFLLETILMGNLFHLV